MISQGLLCIQKGILGFDFNYQDIAAECSFMQFKQ